MGIARRIALMGCACLNVAVAIASAYIGIRMHAENAGFDLGSFVQWLAVGMLVISLLMALMALLDIGTERT
jgi:hypothetical protein